MCPAHVARKQLNGTVVISVLVAELFASSLTEVQDIEAGCLLKRVPPMLSNFELSTCLVSFQSPYAVRTPSNFPGFPRNLSQRLSA